MANSAAVMSLQARHIQNHSEGTLIPHWGYADRVYPCTSGAGTCAYLDVVYHAHDVGMMYIGIIWSTIGAILLVWAFIHRAQKASSLSVRNHYAALETSQQRRSGLLRFAKAAQVGLRKRLLPDGPRWLFGRTSRLQITILAILAGYLFIWSFVGITYQKWITPVKNSTLYNTRTSLGPWSDRVGVLAYGMLPLSVMLSSRESVLTLLTGVPYHHFNFLHRWLGYIILLQSLLHSIGWTIIEARLYQPQPKEWRRFIAETYIVWGCVAMIVVSLLWFLSLPPVIRRTGYEFFRKAHYVLAMIFIGACWGHWAKLQCFLIPSFALWGIDRAARLIRTFLLHYNVIQRSTDGTTSMGFQHSVARAELFDDGSIVRLDFDQAQSQPWHVGQHFFLTFTDSSIWQSHPLTPLSVPGHTATGACRHSYIFRAKGGETKKVAQLVAASQEKQTGVLLTGPYGANIVERLYATDSNILCIAGGTGITYVLPAIFDLLRNGVKQTRQISLVWIVRHTRDVEWVQSELDAILRDGRVQVHIHSTRDSKNEAVEQHAYAESDANTLHPRKPKAVENACCCGVEEEILPVEDAQCGCDGQAPDEKDTRAVEAKADTHADDHRPMVKTFVERFLYNNTNGQSSTVIASGPSSMLSELRTVVAAKNDARRIMRGETDADVDIICDDRLEW